ncbi:DNA helicase [Paraglaciecola Antarctic GD virus 1]|nr:DNA helicase [Paraglaciecola Antarctic GD virus 1]
MNNVNITKVNDVWLKVEAASSIKMELADHFSFFVDNYKFNPKFKARIWDGKIRLYQSYTGLLPIGLYDHLLQFCEQYEYSVNTIDDFKQNDNHLEEWIKTLPITTGGNAIEPRDYQIASVKKMLFDKSMGLMECPTSSGKSLMQYLTARYCLQNYDRKVLITVPTTSLVLQMQNDFIDYSTTDDNFSVDDIHIIMSGKEKESGGARVVISTWQSIAKMPKEYFDQFSCYMADEAHLATAKNMTKIVQSLTDCPIKCGLSGTFKESKSHLLALIGHFGNIYKPVTTRELIDNGTVSNLKIKILKLEYSDAVCKERKGMTYHTEIAAITGDVKRNVKLCQLANGIANQNKNVVMMYKHIKHGEALKNICDKLCKKVYIISGATDVKEREALRAIAESEGGAIIIASLGVFSTGVSIKRLHAIVMTHPMKSKIIILQTIGRILRKHQEKDMATFIDVVDDIKSGKTKSYSLKHAVERIKLYLSQELEYSISRLQL